MGMWGLRGRHGPELAIRKWENALPNFGSCKKSSVRGEHKSV